MGAMSSHMMANSRIENKIMRIMTVQNNKIISIIQEQDDIKLFPFNFNRGGEDKITGFQL
jgi:hypothetical protein